MTSTLTGRRHRIPWRLSAARAFAVLLLISTVAFLVGVALERSQAGSAAPEARPASSPASPAPAAPSTSAGVAAGEASGEFSGEAGGEASAAVPAEPSGEAHAEAAGESTLGVPTESLPLVAGAVLFALIIAVGAWLRTARWLLVLGMLYCLAAVALDLGELAHQLAEHRRLPALVAAVVAALHLAAGAVAGLGAQGARGAAGRGAAGRVPAGQP